MLVPPTYRSLKLDGDSIVWVNRFTGEPCWKGTKPLLLGFKRLLFSVLVSVTGKISIGGIRLYDFSGELEYRSLPVSSDTVQEKSTSEFEKAGLKSAMGAYKPPSSQAVSFRKFSKLEENKSVPA